jgi:hypothetical protein
MAKIPFQLDSWSSSTLEGGQAEGRTAVIRRLFQVGCVSQLDARPRNSAPAPAGALQIQDCKKVAEQKDKGSAANTAADRVRSAAGL